jgi:hypothetical protein
MAAPIRFEIEIPAAREDEFRRLLTDFLAGPLPRTTVRIDDRREIELRATTALATIAQHVEAHDGTGNARRLVRFIAGLYNGEDYPFDLTELRGLDDALANACLDYLNYDRLGITEVHNHLPGGEAQLDRWRARYGLTPKDRL